MRDILFLFNTQHKDKKMTNTKTQTFSEKLASVFNTLETRGQVIAKEYKVLTNAEKHLAKRNNVFDTALGELMFELKCEADGKRIPTSRLQDCGIHNIPKQRRADALFYVENKSECDKVAESSEKGFTNMNALVKATQKARKAEAKSDVGLTAEQIVEQALAKCDKHNVSREQLLLALRDALAPKADTQPTQLAKVA